MKPRKSNDSGQSGSVAGDDENAWSSEEEGYDYEGMYAFGVRGTCSGIPERYLRNLSKHR